MDKNTPPREKIQVLNTRDSVIRRGKFGYKTEYIVVVNSRSFDVEQVLRRESPLGNTPDVRRLIIEFGIVIDVVTFADLAVFTLTMDMFFK